MAFRTLDEARGFARKYFHDATIWKASSNRYEVETTSRGKRFKSWKFVERIQKD